MAAGDWYYQVWEHLGLMDRVREVGTYKLKCDALQAADQLNAKAKYYCGEGHSSVSLYFVQPVLEEHLREATAERFQRELMEDREQILSKYRGAFTTLAKAMVQHTLQSWELCPQETHVRLYDRGGRLDGYSRKIEPFGTIECFMIYSGRGSVQLKVATEKGKALSITTVDIFESEKALIMWLLDEQVAVPAIDDRLLDLFFDRYRSNKGKK